MELFDECDEVLDDVSFEVMEAPRSAPVVANVEYEVVSEDVDEMFAPSDEALELRERVKLLLAVEKAVVLVVVFVSEEEDSVEKSV